MKRGYDKETHEGAVKERKKEEMWRWMAPYENEEISDADRLF
jgi:hypothetical protein